jgi:hypothetical protein
MKWFYRWLGNRIRQVSREENEPNIGLAKPRKNLSIRESDDLHSDPITFKMFKANGGWAIEFRQYDPKNDRHNTSLYVVNGEEELGKHISQIITMEALRR